MIRRNARAPTTPRTFLLGADSLPGADFSSLLGAKSFKEVGGIIDNILKLYSNHFKSPATLDELIDDAKSGEGPFDSFLMLSASPEHLHQGHIGIAAFVDFNEDATAYVIANIVRGRRAPSWSRMLATQLKAKEDAFAAKCATQQELTRLIDQDASFRRLAGEWDERAKKLEKELETMAERLEGLNRKAVDEGLAVKATLVQIIELLDKKEGMEKSIPTFQSKVDSYKARIRDVSPMVEEKEALALDIAAERTSISELKAELKSSTEADYLNSVKLRKMLDRLDVPVELQPTDDELQRMMMWAVKLLHIVDGGGGIMVPDSLLSVHTSLSPPTSSGKSRPNISHGAIRSGAVPNVSIMTAAAHLVAFLCDTDGNRDNVPKLLACMGNIRDKLAIATLKTALYNWFPHGSESILANRRPEYVSWQHFAIQATLFVDAVHAVVGTFYGTEENFDVARLAGLLWLVHEGRGKRDYFNFYSFSFTREPDTVIGPIAEDHHAVFEYKVIALCASMETKAQLDSYMDAYYARMRRVVDIRHFIVNAKKAKRAELQERIVHLRACQQEVPKDSPEWSSLKRQIADVQHMLGYEGGRARFEHDLLEELKDQIQAMRI
jgi:hypothetical protein